jgi:hypothetical protein
MSFVKAGLSLRSGWKLYEKCYEQLKSIPPEKLQNVDRSVRGGVHFGIGSFNTFV